MEIDISGRHFRITAPLRQYAEKKVQKLEKFSLKIESVHIIFEIQRFRHIAEICLLGKNLRVTAKNEDGGDMYAAFDNCLHNAQLQLSRQHDRVKDHKGRRYVMKESPKRTKDED